MHAVIDSAIFQTINLARAKHITIKSNKSQDDAWVLGDGDLLERAVTNLLTNAIKYTDEGTDIETRLQVQETAVKVSIVDQGRGIAERDLKSLFDNFERGSHQGQRGTGIGLYFVKVVASKHAGQIEVRNNVDRGSTFTFSVPLCTEDDDEQGQDDD
jgi:signal transduction histidine kinase